VGTTVGIILLFMSAFGWFIGGSFLWGAVVCVTAYLGIRTLVETFVNLLVVVLFVIPSTKKDVVHSINNVSEALGDNKLFAILMPVYVDDADGIEMGHRQIDNTMKHFESSFFGNMFVKDKSIEKEIASLTMEILRCESNEETKELRRRIKAFINQHQDKIDPNIVLVLASNTGNADLVEYEQQKIKELRSVYGEDKVFYLHGNAKAQYLAKVGCFQNAYMLFNKGEIIPKHYEDLRPDWEQPFYNLDKCIGDLSLIQGKVDLIGQIDEKNTFKPNTIRNIVSYVNHIRAKQPRKYAIYQPKLTYPRGPEYSIFQNVTSWSQEMLFYNTLAMGWIYDHGEYYGKGIIDVGVYIDKIMDNGFRIEKVDGKYYKRKGAVPWGAKSHDMYEGMYGGVKVIPSRVHFDDTGEAEISMSETTNPNFLADVGSLIKRWRIGDVFFLVREFFNPKLGPHQIKRVEMITRGVASEFIFSVFLLFCYIGTIGSLIAITFPFAPLTWFSGVAFLQSITFGWLVFGINIFALIGIPKFFGPVVGRITEKGFGETIKEIFPVITLLPFELYLP
ncbi:MAG: hypothetical protein QME68_07935, partial [Elusimicrobiota bacterium]|nr:hypothetical protein [Elusimicrobiota bacterium]